MQYFEIKLIKKIKDKNIAKQTKVNTIVIQIILESKDIVTIIVLSFQAEYFFLAWQDIS